ncbi:hypothetical protein [Actinomadura rayongensis]|uniref:Uncharacterized protein n=1 Tax=Actinomadura rayongensis TaxID=1429076 RepID=A0A6I4WGB1_9ACTN|nr:hypothetical protein [Actinomadura rayongensis]MXQ66034.1 hypothetical protein [Actinomadura rayongensis]
MPDVPAAFELPSAGRAALFPTVTVLAWLSVACLFASAVLALAGRPYAAFGCGAAGTVLPAAAVAAGRTLRRSGLARLVLDARGLRSVTAEGDTCWTVAWTELADVVVGPGVLSLFPFEGFAARHPEMAGMWAGDGAYRVLFSHRLRSWRELRAAVDAFAPHLRRGPDGPATPAGALGAGRYGVSRLLLRAEPVASPGRRPAEVVAAVAGLAGWGAVLSGHQAERAIHAAHASGAVDVGRLLLVGLGPLLLAALLRRVWAGAPTALWALAVYGRNVGGLLTAALLLIYLVTRGVAALAGTPSPEPSAGDLLLWAGAPLLVVAGALLHRRRVWAWVRVRP